MAAAVRGMHRAGKPIGAFCIAPVILARVLEGVTVTLGQDPGAIANAEKMGAVHQKTGHGEATVDPVNKIVTTPCYMLDARISDIANGAMKAVEELVRL